jgi:hypothetical protein
LPDFAGSPRLGLDHQLLSGKSRQELENTFQRSICGSLAEGIWRPVDAF